MVLTSHDRSQVLFHISYNSHSFSSQPDITVLRGQGGAHVGSAKFHTWASKIDLDVNGQMLTYKDEFDSITGLGRVYWKYQSKKSKGNLKLENRSGQVIATFMFNGWKENEVGKVEIWRPGLSPAQTDEVVVSAVAEIESMKRDNEQVNPGIIAGGVAVAAGGGGA